MKIQTDYDDLTSQLRFSPELGRIWRGSERCVLLSSNALATLRGQIVAQLGTTTARRLFWDIGYAEGSRCAVTAKTIRADTEFLEAFAVGPQAHALTGFGWTEIEALETDETTGHFVGQFRVHDSIEAAIHLAAEGISPDPVCWLQTGFASGFASTFAGQPILMREIQCLGMGDEACVLHAKPASEWELASDQETVQPVLNASEQPAYEGDVVLGSSAGYLAVRNLVERTADTDATLLFYGETGVGKEVFAKLAYSLSRRRTAPFVALNCAAIPEGLIEAELFGVAKGAFTGAVSTRPGRFELANGGTLFLDEIASLSPMAQSKVLRAIQEREFERVGDVKTVRVDVRIMAASNADLEAAVVQGNFRADLYYRLSTLPIHVPPLRQRREDIPALMEHFRKRYARRHDRSVPGFTSRAINALLLYEYPGNIRELERMVERAVLLVDEGQAIDLQHLFQGTQAADIRTSMALNADGHVRLAGPVDQLPRAAKLVLSLLKDGGDGLAAIEEEIIRTAVDETAGNVAQAARDLGLTRRQLAFRLGKMAEEGQKDAQ